MSALTAWRFNGTEGADAAMFSLQQLNTQELIEVLDATVLRWPYYATAPVAHEHVTDGGGKVAGVVGRRLRGGAIDNAMVESVKGDMTPGTSALVLLSSDAMIGAVAQAFEGQDLELIRSDLSVQQQDQIREAFSDQAEARRVRPPADEPR